MSQYAPTPKAASTAIAPIGDPPPVLAEVGLEAGSTVGVALAVGVLVGVGEGVGVAVAVGVGLGVGVGVGLAVTVVT